ncbi:MAG TPA: FAD binding domain-containing protein [Stellaceae bacterium]|nr:FAD binding domain-containing protein [Stellaceae bacterium]
MKPREFDYIAPGSAAEAVEALAALGEGARVLAGGLSLVPMLNFRLFEPGALIDIARIGELDFIRMNEGALEVGAAVTQNALLAHAGLARDVPLLARTLPWVGHFQTRNRGTVCGSVAHADPSAEIPLALAVLGGAVVLRSTRGTRTVAAADFQQGMLTTARAPDELIVAVRFPARAAHRRCAFREVARRHGDFAIVAIAAAVDEGGAVRLGVGGIADRPAVRQIDPSPRAMRDAVDALAVELGGYEDIHASPRYRRDLLRRLGPLVIEEALQCAA